MIVSRIDEVSQGRLAWTTVDLIDIEDSTALPLRNALEQFGIQVNYVAIGQPRHLVAVLGGERPVAPYVIVCCHGVDDSIVLPELGGELAAQQPFNGKLGPAEVRQHLRFQGSAVLSLGCDTGNAELARAFLDSGANHYIAPTDSPYGHASLFAALYLFYELTQERSLEEAVRRLSGHDDELAMWRMYSAQPIRQSGVGGSHQLRTGELNSGL
ncbi:hypothetical protein [Nocardia uniformis]|uniref:hypothetical protein n=1 Tax=Nocardia uniformis TaxID=53432 RepID=UPI000B1A413F|nr:hypothetical protein [Nocardia uniformis]